MMSLLLYDIATGFLSPLVGLGMLGSERGRIKIAERFGSWSLQESRPIIWFHGASLGEVRGMLSVMERFRSEYTNHAILLTSTSATGLDVGKPCSDHQYLLPFDCSLWLGCALDGCCIDAFVLTETELWPSLLRYLKKRSIPSFLINARISDMTVDSYRRLRFLFGPLLEVFSLILAGTEESRSRFADIGVQSSRLKVMGNSKYDGVAVVSESEQHEFCERIDFDKESYTLCLGSIRDGEEEFWLDPIKQLLSDFENVQIIVAPRHKEKFSYFADWLSKHSIPFKRWTDESKSSEQVLLLDTYGKLLQAYAVSHRAFIGATMVDIGGHNPFEAVAQSCPIVVGPHIQNIKSEIADLRIVEGAPLVRNSAEIITVLERDIANRESASEEGKRSAEVWRTHQGSTVRILEEIKSCLSCSRP